VKVNHARYTAPSGVATEDPADCLAKFRSNRVVGWLLFAGIVAGHFA
jgi:hypothetical protein